jgi:hypothetical protein
MKLLNTFSVLALLCCTFVHTVLAEYPFPRFCGLKGCHSSPDCSDDADSKRFDCYPDQGAAEETCESRGCCWKDAKNYAIPLNVPYCFYPKNFGYALVNQQETDTGFLLDLQMQQKGPYGRDIVNLKVDVRLETEYRVHVKVLHDYLLNTGSFPVK